MQSDLQLIVLLSKPKNNTNFKNFTKSNPNKPHNGDHQVRNLPPQRSFNILTSNSNAAKAVSETAQQAVGAGKQEKGEQQVKNDDTLSGKAQGAKDYVSGAAEKQGHGAKSDANNPLK